MSLTDRLMEMPEPLRTGLIELFTSEESHRAFRAATIDFANELIDRNPFDPELRPWFARLKVAWRDYPADLAAVIALENRLPKVEPEQLVGEPVSPDPRDLAVPAANPLGLRSQREAAALLRCSLKALRKYMDDGLLRYVEQPGRGKRPRRMPTDDHLAEFLKNQTKTDTPQQSCQSSRTNARRTGASTSNVVAVAFSDRPKLRPSGKRKR